MPPPKRSVHPAVAKRVVPELLGAGCSLLALKLEAVFLHSALSLDRSWASAFGEAPVHSKMLRELCLVDCGLRGPLPELRLPALRALHLSFNQINGGLGSLTGCLALQQLDLSDNQLAGDLDALKGCTSLRSVDLSHNQLSGGLAALRGCTALRQLSLSYNDLTGDLHALRGCRALQTLAMDNNRLTGDLWPLRDCTALQV